MIVLFTDFGLQGPYMGQMEAVLYRQAPAVPVVRLVADAPGFNPHASAYLLASFVDEFPAETVFLCVVDPGVGSDRRPVIARADNHWFIGPDNGLFHILCRRAREKAWWEISWRPEHLSASFHGRDLFAPVAAMLACGGQPPGKLIKEDASNFSSWPDDLCEVIYIDHYGNAMTGMRVSALGEKQQISIAGQTLKRARTFSDVDRGELFCYENANGMLEIAANCDSAAKILGLRIGSKLAISQEA